jgi:hypothetical protein
MRGRWLGVDEADTPLEQAPIDGVAFAGCLTLRAER